MQTKGNIRNKSTLDPNDGKQMPLHSSTSNRRGGPNTQVVHSTENYSHAWTTSRPQRTRILRRRSCDRSQRYTSQRITQVPPNHAKAEGSTKRTSTHSPKNVAVHSRNQTEINAQAKTQETQAVVRFFHLGAKTIVVLTKR